MGIYTFEVNYPPQNHFENSDEVGIEENVIETTTIELRDGKMFFVGSDAVCVRAGDEFDAEAGIAAIIEYQNNADA